MRPLPSSCPAFPCPAPSAGRKPVALVIAPTRELALQINAVLEEAGSQCGIRCGVGTVPLCLSC